MHLSGSGRQHGAGKWLKHDPAVSAIGLESMSGQANYADSVGHQRNGSDAANFPS